MSHKLFLSASFITLSVFNFNCRSNSNQPKPVSDTSINLLDSQTKVQPVKSPKDSLGAIFYNEQPYEIISLNKGVTLQYTGPDDTTECKAWFISKKDLYSVIRNSKPITGTTCDLAFAFTPCMIEGQIKQKGHLFNYSVNAGSWFSIECRDTVLLYGDYKQTDRKHFLDPPEIH